MRPEPKAASKPVFDYGNSATAQRCFYKQPGFSLRLGSAGIFLSLTGDFAPQSAKIDCGRMSERDKNGGQKMARRNREVGFVKSCVLAAALIAGLALPAPSRRQKADVVGDDGTRHGLHVPRHFQHESRARGCRPSSTSFTASSMPACGDPTPLMATTSRSTTMPASRPNGATSPSISPPCSTRYPGCQQIETSTISKLKAGAPPTRAASGPSASATIGRRIISRFSATRMRSRDHRLRFPGQAVQLLHAHHQRRPRIPVVRGGRRRLHLLERRPDPRLHGTLFRRRPLLGYRLHGRQSAPS